MSCIRIPTDQRIVGWWGFAYPVETGKGCKMAEIQVTMDNVRNVEVEIDDRESFWLHFHEGKDGVTAVVTPELWLSLMSKVLFASQGESRAVIVAWLERAEKVMQRGNETSVKQASQR